MPITLGRSMVGFGAVCIGLAGLYANRMAQIQSDLVAARAELEETILALETKRPVLHGEPIEGLAFDHYKLIRGTLTRRIPEDRMEFIVARDASAANANELRAKLLDGNPRALELLQLGARSTDALLAIDWDEYDGSGLPRLMATRSAVNLAVLAAGRHLDESHPELAVDVLLDALQLGRDVFEVPTMITDMIGSCLLSISTDALLDGELLARFPPNELARLARGLKLLDESLPEFGHAQEGELLLQASLALRGDQPAIALTLDPSLELWAYGFSPRALCADHILNCMRDRAALRGLENESWSVRETELARQQSVAEASPNYLSRQAPQFRMTHEGYRRKVIARLRLARSAVQYTLSGEAPTLPDPFGGKLRVTEVGGKIRIESGFPAGAGQAEQCRIELTLRE